jgi:hypothetical protein
MRLFEIAIVNRREIVSSSIKDHYLEIHNHKIISPALPIIYPWLKSQTLSILSSGLIL